LHTYRIVTRPDIRYAHVGQIGLPLRAESLVGLLSGLVVNQAPSEDRLGRFIVDLSLDGQDPEEALSDIADAVKLLGFSVVEATVSEWADEATEQAVLYALSGVLVGGATTENPTVALVAGAVGAIIGHLAGSQVRKLTHQYEARPLRFGWHIQDIGGQQTIPRRGLPRLSAA
jgi:uncharacterized membrane protein